jgi:hypothetical protein
MLTMLRESDRELWRVPQARWAWSTARCPIFGHGLVYLTTRLSRHLMGVHKGAKSL